MADKQPDNERVTETSAPEAAEMGMGGVDAPEAIGVDAPEAELEAVRAQAAEHLEGWQRTQAEFANYKKRMERERAEIYQNAADALIARFLGVLDDFERALKDKPPMSGEAARWAAGVELIYRKLQGVLEAQGIVRMEAAGQTFDPKLHDAVTHEESEEHEEGQIIEMLQPGYKRGEKVIRPAMVRVARSALRTDET